MDYIKKLEKEYDKSPKAFHEHTSEIKQSQKEIKRITLIELLLVAFQYFGYCHQRVVCSGLPQIEQQLISYKLLYYVIVHYFFLLPVFYYFRHPHIVVK